MTIRFVYFDLGNILFSFTRERAANNVAKLLNVETGRADHVLHNEGLQEEIEHGQLSSTDYAQLVCDRLDRGEWLAEQPNRDRAAAMLADAISDMFTPIDEMAGVVAATRRTVGRIGILSNTCEAHWDWITRMRSPIMDLTFDQVVLSCRVGSMKPDDKIYRVAQSLADCDPSEILFIDDKTENVTAAKSRGWNAEVCLGGPTAVDVLRGYDAIGSVDSVPSSSVENES